MADEFDYVIVGAGAAGSVLAARLSEDPDIRVCVLEAGPPDRNIYIHIPVGYVKTIADPKVNWLYETEASAGTAGRRLPAPQGRTLGGTTSINGHIYNRGQAMDFDRWAQLGNRGWSYAEVLPYFRRCEGRIGPGDDRYRGRDGPLKVTDLTWRHPLNEAFVEAALARGIPFNPDYNGARQAGVGYYQRAIHKGRRVSAARAFLHPAMQRGNLEVRTDSQAVAVLLDGRRAAGVRYARGGPGGGFAEVRARREVIVSAGAIASPRLLQLSGIGPAPLLQGLGIEVRHELPGVGENLRDHYAPRLVARVKGVETVNQRVRGMALAVEVTKWLIGRPSVIDLQPSLVHVFWMSDPALQLPDIQLLFAPASLKEGRTGVLDDFPGMTCGVWQHRPESTGYVRARSAEPFEKPAIQPNYLAEEIDRRVLLAGMRLTLELFKAPAFAPYFERMHLPAAGAESDAELMAYAREYGGAGYHFCGTCHMGPASDPLAVVDAELRVHGLEGLRIADASVMPTMPSANTNASTLMIGEKAADMIRGRAPLEAAGLDAAVSAA
jgi:choline dehydrogenase-like flavoprotein